MTDKNIFDTKNPFIQKVVSELTNEKQSETEKAIILYNYVRDNWYYSPLRISLKEEDYQIDNLVDRKKGHCIDKAIILITLLRAVNIKANLGLAKVQNHIAAEKVVAFLGTNVLVPHGYVDIFLNQKWVKATPAFNDSLCEKIGVSPLEFNGLEDSIFQKFDTSGTQFMEYIEDYGAFEELPILLIEELLLTHYPILKQFGLKIGTVIDAEQF